MFHKGTLVPAAMLGITLLASPRMMLAQRGGGGGGMGGGGGAGAGGGRNTTPAVCVHSCSAPNGGLDPTDYLKDFHRAMAVQANAEQRAAFAKVAQYTQAASDQLQAFRESLQKVPASSPSDRAAALDQAIEKARSGNQNFLASLSPAQKSGLEDTTKKLAKADAEFDKQLKLLDQIVQTKPASEQISSSTAVLDKALAGFQNEQLALGREMSILFDPARQDVTFSLPAVTNSVIVDGQLVSILASGAVSRTSAATPAAVPAEHGPNLFNLRLVADLSDLQLNVTGILRSELTRSPRCGERIEVLQATLTPLEPASLVVVRVHFERWICPPGQQSPIEVASGEGTLEVKLTLSVEPAAAPAGTPTPATTESSGTLHLVSEITRVDASGFVRDSLRSGDLGANLRDQIAASLLSALRMGTDPKATLPPAAQKSATLQKARFQDDGADQLSLVLDGQLQLSDEQTQQFAAQLKQRLSAQGTSPQ
ncbi:MAG TPA: hypothetical protein VKH18_14050 [Terriglobales bacterium]|nr:hypothetical protein [Terriglobales bacterium]